jgi:site-specific recombinase XerD
VHAYAPLCAQCFSIVCTYTFAINLKIMIPTISFYVFKNRQNKRGDVKVYLRFTNDRKSNYKSTNVSVPANMWDHNKQKVKSAYKLSNATNMLLERKISEVREEIMHSALKNKHISSKQARNIAFSKSNLSFFKIADEYVAKFLKEEKFGSYDKYKSIYSKFGNFLGGRSATFYDIDIKSLNDFQYYLKTECKNKVNTIHNNLKAVNRIFNIAIERGIITSNDDPFRTFKIKQEKTTRDFLSLEEVAKIASLELAPDSYLEKCRDMFLWTILAGGLRVSDVLSLRKTNIDGQIMTLVIQKTNTPHRIKLPDHCYQILKRFIDKIDEADGYVFGMLDESAFTASAKKLDQLVASATAKYNKALKVLATMAEISKTIGSHQARISFVTIAAQNGVPLTTIQGMVCHSKIDMTALYSKYVDNQGDEALKMLEKKIIQ